MSINPYKADIHKHTVLSPCGDLEMSPINIVMQAKKKGLDMIAITDHNTTRQVAVYQKIGNDKGLLVIGGVEITTKEEAHVLTFFPNKEKLALFQTFLDNHLPKIPNNEDRFGYQLIVNEDEEIVAKNHICLLMQ